MTDATSSAGGSATPPPTTRPTSPWATRETLPTFSPAPGITAQMVTGEGLMTVWMRIAPGTTLAVHAHPNEQIGVVLEGAIAVTIGGETRRVEPGGAYVVPPELPHGGVTGPEGCLVLESFAPPREVFRALAATAGDVRGRVTETRGG